MLGHIYCYLKQLYHYGTKDKIHFKFKTILDALLCGPAILLKYLCELREQYT